MSVQHHTRATMQKLVDDFYQQLKDQAEAWDGDIEDITLDTITIVAMAVTTDDDGDEVEQPAMLSTSRRPHVQLGVLQTAIERQKNNMAGAYFIADDDDDED